LVPPDSDTVERAEPASSASSTCSGVVSSSAASSAIVGERPSRAVSRSIAFPSFALSSFRFRGIRIADPRSRKWRLISPTTFGVA
jgi:hypothetical protein